MNRCKWMVLVLFLSVSGFADPPETVDIRFQALRLEEGLPETLFLQSGDSWVEVRASMAHFGHAVRYQGGNPLRLYRQAGDGEAAGYEAVAELTLAVAEGEILLLLSRGEDRMRMNAVVLDETMPAGSFLFVNRSPYLLHLQLGGVELAVGAGEKGGQRPDVKERGVLPFAWTVKDAPDTLLNPGMETSWFYNPDRWYVVIFGESDHTIVVRNVTRFP